MQTAMNHSLNYGLFINDEQVGYARVLTDHVAFAYLMDVFILPEQEPNVAADIEPQAVLEPGLYVLQAGSFSAFADADRRRAELGLHGIESQIQRVTIDDRTYHRVRIGPTSDLDELNMFRSRLRAAQIDVLRIRLGD